MKRIWLIGVVLLSVTAYASQYKMIVTSKNSDLITDSTFTHDIFELPDVKGYGRIFGSIVVNQGSSVGGDTANFGDADSVEIILETRIGELVRIIGTANSVQIPGTLFVRGDTLYEKLFLRVHIWDSLGMSDTSTTPAKFRTDIRLKVID